MSRICNRCALYFILAVGVALGSALPLCAQQPPQKPLPEGYIRPAPVTATGLAPKMRVEELPAAASPTFKVTFGTGDELLAGLTEFAEKNHIASAHITGIGGLLTATLGWGDPSVGAMKKIAIDRKCELVSLLGNISSRNGHPYVHLHAIVSFSDGSTQGGHLIEAHVDPLAEIFIVTTDQPTQKYWYEENAMRADIIDLKLGKSADSVVVQITNLGPLTVYMAAPVGTARPVPPTLKGLFQDSWRRISVPSDARASCSLSLKPGDSLQTTVYTDHRMYGDQRPTKIQASGVTVYRTLEDCKQNRMGFAFSSLPRDY